MQRCFGAWVAAPAKATPLVPIAIDGQSARGSADRAHGKAALHLVSAWACHNRLTLAQAATDEKSDEITAIPQLLRPLGLHGATVSVGARGCQKGIARQIREQGAPYGLALKDTPPGRLADVRAAVEGHCGRRTPGDGSSLATRDTGHGRREERLDTRVTDLSGVTDREAWPDLAAGVAVWRERAVGAGTSGEMRYSLTSFPGALEELAAVIRGQGGIENKCHWALDGTFREGGRRKRAEHGAEDAARLRRMAPSLLANEPTPKLTLKQKSVKALCDHDFLLSVPGQINGWSECT